MKLFLSILLVGLMGHPISAFSEEAAVPPENAFDGTVQINSCSGALVTLQGRPADAPALVLTNGHCIHRGSIEIEGQTYGWPAPGESFVHAPVLKDDKASLMLKKRTATLPGTSKPVEMVSTFPLTLTQLVYATMTSTDIAFYETKETYMEIENKTGMKPYLIAKDPSFSNKTQVRVPSTFWYQQKKCFIEEIVSSLQSSLWTWGPSLRLSESCSMKRGASGSPLIDVNTNEVVGVLNAVCPGGQEESLCVINNRPASTIGLPDAPFGQKVNGIYACLDAKGKFDVGIKGCLLPTPKLTQESEAE